MRADASILDAGPSDVDSGPASSDASAGLDASLRPLDWRARAISDGGVVELRADAANEGIDPAARFELELGALRDVRVRLFDEADRAVPSTDRLERGVATRYSLIPTEPLAPGSGYAFVVDGLEDWDPVDATGAARQPARIGLRTAGEKPAPPPGKAPTKPKKKAKKRGP